MYTHVCRCVHTCVFTFICCSLTSYEDEGLLFDNYNQSCVVCVCQYALFRLCIINHVIMWVFMFFICVYICLHLLHLLLINELRGPPFLLHGIFNESTLLFKKSMKPTYVGNFPQSESSLKIQRNRIKQIS